jgi:hypothetical protein
MEVCCRLRGVVEKNEAWRPAVDEGRNVMSKSIDTTRSRDTGASDRKADGEEKECVKRRL